MTELERLEQHLLDGARRYLSPSASDRVRVQSTLSRGEAWWQPASLRPSWVRRVTRSFGAGVTLGLVLGTLVGYGASHVAGVRHAHQHSAELARGEAAVSAAGGRLARAAAPPVAPAPNATTAAANESAPKDEQAPLAAHDQEHPHSGAAEARAGSSSVLRRAVQRRASRSSAQRSSLAEELSLLSRARRALNRDQANLALGIVLSLDERFPNGVLMEEREATRILCLCALARTEEARSRGQRFLALHAASVYAERVQDSCAGAR